MGNIFNPDFRDFILALNNNSVEYILLGGYAVILHGHNRSTGDMDIWVNKNEENYLKLVLAFKEFGMPVFDMTLEKFLDDNQFDVFTFGVSPVCIDIMTKAKGLEFESAYKNSYWFEVDNLPIRLIHLDDLITAKLSVKRPKDLDDINHLK